MKKITLLVAFISFYSVATAQIKTEAGTFSKPTAGSIHAELSFAPNLSSQGLFSLPALSNTLNDAFGLKFRKFTSDSRAIRVSANLTIDNQESNTDYLVGVGYGIEKHMKGAERLSTFYGYEASLAIAETEGTKLFGIGANVFTGFDYYIMPNIYLGSEISYGFKVLNTKEEGLEGTTQFKLAPGVTPFLRLGWRF